MVDFNCKAKYIYLRKPLMICIAKFHKTLTMAFFTHNSTYLWIDSFNRLQREVIQLNVCHDAKRQKPSKEGK